MRRHYWQFLLNGEGQPIVGASVDVYLEESETYANISLTEDGAYTTTALTSVLSSSTGYFEFYIGDKDDSPSLGYEYTQRFKLKFTKAGEIDMLLDKIDVFALGSQGTSGYSGYSGYSGVDGTGVSGYSGISGYSGYSGARNFITQEVTMTAESYSNYLSINVANGKIVYVPMTSFNVDHVVHINNPTNAAEGDILVLLLHLLDTSSTLTLTFASDFLNLGSIVGATTNNYGWRFVFQRVGVYWITVIADSAGTLQDWGSSQLM